jgi:hypothetical protein
MAGSPARLTGHLAIITSAEQCHEVLQEVTSRRPVLTARLNIKFAGWAYRRPIRTMP